MCTTNQLFSISPKKFVSVVTLENLCNWGQIGVSFPLVLVNLVLDIKLFVYKAFKTTRSYGANVKGNNSIVYGLVEDILRPLLLIKSLPKI